MYQLIISLIGSVERLPVLDPAADLSFIYLAESLNRQWFGLRSLDGERDGGLHGPVGEQECCLQRSGAMGARHHQSRKWWCRYLRNKDTVEVVTYGPHTTWVRSGDGC